MSDFETSGEISVSITDQSLRQARSDIESLGGVEVDVASQAAGGGSLRSDGGVSSQLAGGGAAILEDSANELVEYAQERNVMLSEILEATEREAATGGGGGGSGGMVTSMLAMSGLSSMLGTVSLGSLVTSVSAGTLIKAVPAAATIITGGVMAKNLIEGDVKASDIIDPLNNLGDLVTGPLSLPDYVETGVGLGTFIAGGVSIASFLTGTSITGLISSASITSLLSGASVSSILSGGVAASSLVKTSGAALLPAAAIIGTTVAANRLIDGKVYIQDYLSGSDPETGRGTMYGEGTPTVPRGPEGDPLDGEGVGPRQRSPDALASDIEKEIDQVQSNAREDTRDSGSDQSSGSSKSQSSGNEARDRSGSTTIEHSPTYNIDTRRLERAIERDLRKFKRKLNDLEKQIEDAGRGT